jgi:hypothetical protein
MGQDENTSDFEARRRALAHRLGSRGPLEIDRGTLIVLPSITFPTEELRKIIAIQYYEERLLFFLLALANPDLTVVFPTSMRVEEPIVDYYLGFLPDPFDAAKRLYLMAMYDKEPRALVDKILERDWAVDRLRDLAQNEACLVTFNVTESEARLAELIGAPLYGPHPDLTELGSKSGSRRSARDADVPVMAGAEDLYSEQQVLDELRALAATAEFAVIKLNEGFSGQGNVIVKLSDLGSSLAETPVTFCASEESWDTYLPKIDKEGVIVEELLRTQGVVSPSVQARIAPDGTFEIVSTHDQILGGPDDQVYLGCRFPADDRYRAAITNHARGVAQVLADKGVVGPFGIDFLVMPESEGGQIFLSEINLRMGGTTHPFLMARLVTGGTYDIATDRLLVDDQEKFFVASDNLKSESYKGLEPAAVIAEIDRAGLAFDPVTKTGALLHLMGALKHYGKIGTTCIANSRSEAAALYDMVVATLDAL